MIFITSALWQPNSPYLNAIDYTTCSVLQERIPTKISDVDELKRRIISEWAALSLTVIDSAVKERRQRHTHLRSCWRRTF